MSGPSDRRRIAVKTIYLDHNIAHYCVRGFLPNVDGPAERDVLQRCLSAPVDFRFALTDWHLVEAARECTHGDDPQHEGRRYADFFESLTPLFLDGTERWRKRKWRLLRIPAGICRLKRKLTGCSRRSFRKSRRGTFQRCLLA